MSSDVRMPLNGSLIIPSASQADNGCYICELRGVSGVVSTRACITVLIPPFFYLGNEVENNVGNFRMVQELLGDTENLRIFLFFVRTVHTCLVHVLTP